MWPDPARLRATVEHLQAIERPSASDGERRAAAWICAELSALGCRARVEAEPAHGSFAIPLGLLSAAGAAAGLSRRAGRLAGATGLAAAGAIADDVTAGPQLFRRLLPRRRAFNVVAEAGDPAGRFTLVFVAHHDAARGGLVFHPGPTRAVAHAFPGFYERRRTSPRLMRITVAGPALAGLGALAGRRRLRRAGGLVSLASVFTFADIATRTVVPGANDNLAAVAVLLELARWLRDEPPRGVRVLLVSTGAEESFMEGMRGFVARHRASLPPDRTRIVVMECIGGPEPIVLEGEGMLQAHDYPLAVRDWLALCGERAGHPLRRHLRSGFATDALPALKAGYATGVLAAVDAYKLAPHYHTQRDVAANLDLRTVAAVSEVCREAVRSFSLPPPAPAPA
jgi:hypothetical protein